MCLQDILSILWSASKVLISRLFGENKRLYAKAVSLGYGKELLRYLMDFFYNILTFAVVLTCESTNLICIIYSKQYP